ncbi:MAG: ATP synthase epsilon chain [Candidatus Magasanikbacteria bacterium GW2011_GWA2_45_39]|uniref:ATP synthase epsilon chain n=2 Tax=Candidatus Magasanikiibacteriota TaxID=1752731 RepID=A0A0G1MZ09_9BACT|nr:MAG: ATP synthase epsilon chain [Candidatus Magasanikbacteria bacterium GW2011_GWA2_45_39]KKU13484.1 MAG: ATP synthase epsilon chain [Candidatus Magasanikbacteria bacterium GW2011_GWC2_45_8]HBW73926.1 ATP synthase F1 subunit epsilon [Candidatus Magasanikbacteria bacterium]
MSKGVLHIQLTTPERIVYKADVEELSLPTSMGEITVLPNHIPLIATLAQGEIRAREVGGEKIFACSGGFIEIKPDGTVVILADNAERAEEIDEARADIARKRAEELMKEKVTDQVEYAAISTKLERELARLRVVRKHRNRHASTTPPQTS